MNWEEQDAYGTIFSTVHKLILSLSAGAVIRNFYLVPKNNGLITKFEFPDENGLNDSMVTIDSEAHFITSIQA